MSNISVLFPRVVSKGLPIAFDATSIQELFACLVKSDTEMISSMFRDTEHGVAPKNYVSMFVNDTMVHDFSGELSEGDRVTFAIAVAGG